jgi:hypothetical protein
MVLSRKIERFFFSTLPKKKKRKSKGAAMAFVLRFSPTLSRYQQSERPGCYFYCAVDEFMFSTIVGDKGEEGCITTARTIEERKGNIPSPRANGSLQTV